MEIDWKKVYRKADYACLGLKDRCRNKYGICLCEKKAIRKEIERQIGGTNEEMQNSR